MVRQWERVESARCRLLNSSYAREDPPGQVGRSVSGEGPQIEAAIEPEQDDGRGMPDVGRLLGSAGFAQAVSAVTPFAAVQKQSVGATIGGLVLLLGLVALAIFGARITVRKLRSGRAPASPDEQALAAATNSLDHACGTFKKNLKVARAAVFSAQRKYVTAVSAAEKRAPNARVLPCLGRAGRIKVYADRIVTPEGVHPMDEQVRAVVDAVGVIAVTRRHTVTRLALLGPFSLFTPKATTHDNRELYFLVEHPQWITPDKPRRSGRRRPQIGNRPRDHGRSR